MRYLLILLFLAFYEGLSAQTKQDIDPINEITLNTHISEFDKQLYLITGNEDVYIKYDWLRRSIKKNIEKGIREGIYEGNILNRIDVFSASKTTLHFFKDELFKVRWTFYGEPEELEKISNAINLVFANTYGNVSNETSFGLKVWEGEKNRLQTFLEPSEFQIEYRDDKINKIIESLE